MNVSGWVLSPLGPSGETRVTKTLLGSFGEQPRLELSRAAQRPSPRFWGCLRGSVYARGGEKRGCWREESGVEGGSRTERPAATDTPLFPPWDALPQEERTEETRKRRDPPNCPPGSSEPG